VTPARKTLATYGSRGFKVRVLVHNPETVRVQWNEGPRGHKKLKTRDWPNNPAARTMAKEWAKGFAEARILPVAAAQLTLRMLWERYAEAQFPQLRQRSQEIYTEYWTLWERIWGRDFLAEDATLEMVDQYRTALRKRGLQASTIGETIRTVKRVYKWGMGRELLTRNRIAAYEYRVHKDERRESPAEYSAVEFAQILAALNPDSPEQWRAHVAIAICGFQGVRQNAALHLKWADVDELEGRITWRSEWDKRGKEWVQPLRSPTRAALAIARAHHVRMGITSDWVLPTASSKSKLEVYSAQSLWSALRRAEGRSGVATVDRRAAHGLRRLLAGEVNALTGDVTTAMHAIGDTDLRVMTRYLKKRDDRVESAFDGLDRAIEKTLEKGREAPQESTANRDQTVNDEGLSKESPSQPAMES
jgi:integrase